MMILNNVFNAKTARFVALTIILGAIGSGAWEWVLKPALTTASEFGLNIATLGIKNFKDSLYKDIALGFHEEPSMRLYIAVFNFLPSFVLGILTGIRIFGSQKGQNNEENKVAGKIIDKLTRPMIIVVVFLLVFSMIQGNQMAYIGRAITHFQMLTKIAGPYLTEDQRLIYQSRYSQISSKDDYAKLVNELSVLCKFKNLKTPTFTIW
jgi:hypothetical protein